MNITLLKPNALWKHFADICSIPHPSKKEEAMIAFMKNFGEKLGLETIVDSVGNVIIRKPATPGMENRKGIVLQGHLDMVPQKNSDVNHDFENDPILPYIDGDWVTAKGTTLGSDNGIGIAAAMAVLEATDLVHGPIEALFTIDEETGMGGAIGLKPGILKGDILANLDSEDEGELYIGCAGGMDANILLNYEEIAPASGSTAFCLSITGLKGGHSGLDIILGRGNANKLMVRFLKNAVRKTGLQIASIDGGNLRNAIPRESFAVVSVPLASSNEFLESIKTFENIFKKELGAVEPNLTFTASPVDMPACVIATKSQNSILSGIYACPNGVIRMSDAMPGVVETSTNLAIVNVKSGVANVKCLMRSSVDSAKDDLGEMILSAFELTGATITLDGEYPGWKPNIDSPILKAMKEVYNNKFGKVPEVKVIHAGLECGILGSGYPNWDMISFGPTIRFPHSPDEKVNIASVEKFWDFLIETLKHVPSK